MWKLYLGEVLHLRLLSLRNVLEVCEGKRKVPAGFLDLLYKSISDTHKFIAVCSHCSLHTRSSKGATAEKGEQAGCLGLKGHRISATSPWRLCTSPWSWPSSQLPLATRVLTSKAHWRVRTSKTWGQNLRNTECIFAVIIHCMLSTIKWNKHVQKSFSSFIYVFFKRGL